MPVLSTPTPDAARLARMGLDTCKPNCGCQCEYDVKACRDWNNGVRLIQNYRQPVDERSE
jgi:hypothetical protein